MTTATVPRLGYRPALDGVRGIAILLVLGNHVGPLLGGTSLTGGFIGVDVFFALSGFLITTLLLERAGEPLRRFYTRRALRLLPALYVLLIVVTLIGTLRRPSELGDYLRADLFAVTYLTNWGLILGAFDVPYLFHLWTLAVEEQFYLLLPVLLFFVLRRWPRHILAIVLCVAALSTVWRAILATHGANQSYVRLSLETHLSTLLGGAALALARWKGMTFPRWARCWPIAIVVLGVIAFVSPHDQATVHNALGAPIVDIAAVTLVLGAVTCSPRVLRVRPLVVLGMVSYSVYLWHVPVIYIIGDEQTLRSVQLPLAIVAVAAASYLSYCFVERPFLRLKDGKAPRRLEQRYTVV